MKLKYFVSRQAYWPEGRKAVEISVGGLDYANPDMLVPRYKHLGEGLEYDDPREAAKAAIAIAKAWSQDEGEEIPVAYGCTLGFTMPFEPSPEEKVLAWAEQEWEQLPKCAECGDPIPDENYWCLEWAEDLKFCSEQCAERAYEKLCVTEEEEEEEQDGAE